MVRASCTGRSATTTTCQRARRDADTTNSRAGADCAPAAIANADRRGVCTSSVWPRGFAALDAHADEEHGRDKPPSSKWDPVQRGHDGGGGPRVAVDVRTVNRTPSPTPSEAKELAKGVFDWSAMMKWRYWIRREWACP